MRKNPATITRSSKKESEYPVRAPGCEVIGHCTAQFPHITKPKTAPAVKKYSAWASTFTFLITCIDTIAWTTKAIPNVHGPLAFVDANRPWIARPATIPSRKNGSELTSSWIEESLFLFANSMNVSASRTVEPATSHGFQRPVPLSSMGTYIRGHEVMAAISMHSFYPRCQLLIQLNSGSRGFDQLSVKLPARYSLS